MVKCPDCGNDVKEAKFCSNCGAFLSQVETAVKETADNFEEDIEDNENENVGVKTDNKQISNTFSDNSERKSKFCSNCGSEADIDVAFCSKCGFKFHNGEPQTKFCQTCGKKININAEICPHCGVRVAGVSASEEKNVLLAAILSFLFPGLGHLYNGLTKKGVSFIVVYIVSAILILLLIGIVLVLIVWIWALVDAIKTTEAINKGEFVEDKLF